ncbi:MAG: tetratricopeptide repeat protein [Nitrospirales bacterium]
MGYRIKTDAPPGGGMDEADILTGKDQFLFFVEQNRNAVLASFCLILVAAAIGGFLVWQDRQATQDAWVLEGQAQALYLDRSLEDGEASKGNIDKAAELYRQILEEYPRTTPAQSALYLLGNSLMEKKEYQGAIQSYEQFLEEYGRNVMLQGLVRQRLGYAYLLKGDRGKAVEAFSQILADPGAFNRDQVMFELAKLEESDGSMDKALVRYKDLLMQFPTSPYASEATLRVQALSPEDQQAQSSEKDSETLQDEDSTESTELEKKVEDAEEKK